MFWEEREEETCATAGQTPLVSEALGTGLVCFGVKGWTTFFLAGTTTTGAGAGAGAGTGAGSFALGGAPTSAGVTTVVVPA